MTMLDDETLSAYLHELGDSFAVPASGMADTLRRVRRGDDERDREGSVEGDRADGRPAEGEPAEGDTSDAEYGPGAVSRAASVRRMLRAHRVLAVAAALIVLLALAGGAAILGSSSPPTRTAAGPPRSRVLTPSPTRGPQQPLSTTTIPQKSSSSGTTFRAESPSAAAPATSSGTASDGAASDGAATSTGGAASTGASSLPAGRGRAVGADRTDRLPRSHRGPWRADTDDEQADVAGVGLRRFRGQLPDPVEQHEHARATVPPAAR